MKLPPPPSSRLTLTMQNISDLSQTEKYVFHYIDSFPSPFVSDDRCIGYNKHSFFSFFVLFISICLSGQNTKHVNSIPHTTWNTCYFLWSPKKFPDFSVTSWHGFPWLSRLVGTTSSPALFRTMHDVFTFRKLCNLRCRSLTTRTLHTVVREGRGRFSPLLWFRLHFYTRSLPAQPCRALFLLSITALTTGCTL